MRSVSLSLTLCVLLALAGGRAYAAAEPPVKPQARFTDVAGWPGPGPKCHRMVRVSEQADAVQPLTARLAIVRLGGAAVGRRCGGCGRGHLLRDPTCRCGPH